MNIEYLFPLLSLNTLLNLLDILIDIFHSHFNALTLQSFPSVFADFFAYKFCGVDYAISKFLEPGEKNLIEHPRRIYFIIKLSRQRSMLKFKEMKRTIVQARDKNISPLQASKRCAEGSGQGDVRKVYQVCSPMAKIQGESRFDTDGKKNGGQFVDGFFKSDTKENYQKQVYGVKGATFGELSGKKLEFGATKKRKASKFEASEYYQMGCETQASKNNNLSFANLLQSKKPQQAAKKSKFYIETDRKHERQSSISKLKEKLFGMKKVISQKERERPSMGAHTPKACHTQRQMTLPSQTEQSREDLVRMSLKGESPPHELDMAPYF